MTTRFIPSAGGAARSGDDPPPRAARLVGIGATDLAQFREALHEQRRFRTEQLHELDARAAADHEDGPLSEVSAALRVAARAALVEVEAAIERLALGGYGLCQQCGGDIALARLEIVPMAALCMDCQRAQEAGEFDR